MLWCLQWIRLISGQSLLAIIHIVLSVLMTFVYTGLLFHWICDCLLLQAAAFWKCLESSETVDDEDDSGALAAVGCLRAIGTILESVSRLPDLFPLMEPTLLPIMQRMLTTDGQGWLSEFSHCSVNWISFAYDVICIWCFCTDMHKGLKILLGMIKKRHWYWPGYRDVFPDVFEEVLEIVSYMTYFSPVISLNMWSLWPLMVDAVQEWAIDYFESEYWLLFSWGHLYLL